MGGCWDIGIEDTVEVGGLGASMGPTLGGRRVAGQTLSRQGDAWSTGREVPTLVSREAGDQAPGVSEGHGGCTPVTGWGGEALLGRMAAQVSMEGRLSQSLGSLQCPWQRPAPGSQWLKQGYRQDGWGVGSVSQGWGALSPWVGREVAASPCRPLLSGPQWQAEQS